jgi:hypothetical protein
MPATGAHVNDGTRSWLRELAPLVLIRRRVAAVLRRFVDRIDSPEPEPPKDMVLINRSQLREIQAEGLQMVIDYAWVSRERGPGEGLLWFPRQVLQSIDWLVRDELEMRDRDFATIESDPQTVWR